MKLYSVSSANLQEIGYDRKKRELLVRFNSGPGVYAYEEVPHAVFLLLLEANFEKRSVGELFQELVRSKGYFFRRPDGTRGKGG